MIKISKQNNSLIVEGIENVFYPNNGQNSYPLNSLIVVTDNSDMATFRSVATNDVLFSGLIQNITINGEAVTKDNIIQKFDAVSNSSTGGGSTVDAYTKQEADNKFASKDELTNVQTVANDADTKVDALTPRVEGVETAMGNKQDILVSGTNIKTINSQSILGSGDLTVSGVSDEQAQEIAKIPTLETELAQKANASDVPTAQTGEEGTNKNYIFSSLVDDNYSVYSKFTFKPNEKGIQMEADNWGSNHNRATLFQIPLVTTSKNGVMSAADKTKLDSIPETIPSQSEIDGIAANVSALQTAMDGKQPTLVSGTNIKTINGNSILGEGNLVIEGGGIDLSNYYTKTETDTKLDTKQNTLVSGTNIKTVNSQSILGSGDLTVSGVSDEQAQEIAKIPTLETELAQKANASDVPTAQTGRNGTNKNYVYSEGKIYSLYETHNVLSNLASNRSSDGMALYVYIWGDSNVAKSVTLAAATTTEAGVMTAADKTKLDSIPETIPSQSEIDGIAADVSALQTAMDGKQPTLVSGTNIKTINGNSILGEGNLVIEGGGIDLSNYYTKTETDTKLDTKQNTLVSGTNIKTVNSQSILGEGNIEVTIPDATTATSGAMSAADKTKLDSISNEWTGTQAEYDALATKEDNIIYYVTE